MTIPDVSVVIASHRPRFMADLLAALAAQTLERGRFEIIAVCDYPVGGLQSSFGDATFYYVNDRSISAKRNIGVGRSQAEIVAFIDDDCLPSAGWIAGGLTYLAAHPELTAVEGLTTIENADYRPPALRDYRRLESPGFRTNNIFYRKKAFLDAGGFDERFTVQREDIDLALTILDKGCTIGHCAEIIVAHRLRRNEPWDLLKNCSNRRFDPLLFKKHPAPYRQHIGSPFPPTLLMLLGFHCMATISLLFGFPFFAACGLLDAAATTVLTLRRCGKHCSPVAFIPEWVSCFLAPVVLAGALLYGSIRYRKLLLV
jgi:GT2 family glycosyltransferase